MHKWVSVSTIIWRDKNEKCLQQLEKNRVQSEHSTTEKLEISKVFA